MKTKTSTLCLVMLVIGLATAVADEKAATRTKEKPGARERDNPAFQTESVQLTGSYIKRTVRRSGRITDGANNVVVIDRAMIERSGASDLKDLLARQGLGR